jgi:hypothetical protein
MEMAGEVLPVVKKTPVLAGVNATDPFRLMPQFLKQDTVFPRKPESADEYIARIREQASQWANGLAP